MKIFNYDSITGAFIGSDYADASPLEPDAWLIPAHATATPPPTCNDDQIQVFNGENWTIVFRQVDIESTAPMVTPADAAAAKRRQIEAHAAELQSQNFTWSGHSMYADSWSTKTLESCLTVSIALGLADTAPVRVPFPLEPGYWFTADVDATGNRIAIPFTVGDLKQALTALYDRNGAIWGRQIIHIATLEAMLSSGATATEIAAYNHTMGWD